jgi:hypothetical protein
MLATKSDHADTNGLLEQIAQLCAAHGAHWQPELQVEVRQGSLRLLAPPGTSGELITMPTALLVPIAGARWAESTEELQLLEPPALASAVQKDLLQLHIALYNATGKLRWWSQQHPARLVEASAAIADVVASLKPANRQEPKERSAAEGFLATRSFGWKPSPDQEDHVPVLMPLIDLLNHHHRGAPFRISDGAMRIQADQAGSSECFAHYGHRRDVLDLALHYGYCDHSTPFAHSAPLEIAVDGVGHIRVEHQGQRAPLHPFDPPRVTLEADGLRLSHLCCHLEHPARVSTMLRLALKGSLKRRGHTEQVAARLAEQGLQAVAAANISLLDQLRHATEASQHPGAAILAAAAQRQAAIISAVI